MTNVTSITHQRSVFPQESTLYFPVVQKPLYYKHKDTLKREHVLQAPDHKLIVRITDSGDNVTPLAVVGINYKVILNDELFPHIERRMLERLEPHLLRDVEVKEEQSYGGRDCYRHYTFPAMRCDVPGGGDVAFRLIVGNSYGAKSVQLIAGAIDFFCSNGMIIGTFEKAARKHTKGLTVQGLDKWIDDSVTYFTKFKETMAKWSVTYITDEETLFNHLVEKKLMSRKHADEMCVAMHAERSKRADVDMPPSLWHLQSALTNWATHGAIRNTGNDHAANTRLDRGRHVNRIMQQAEAFMREAA